VPGGTCAPAAGVWRMTRSSGTVSLCSSVTGPGTSPAAANADTAAARESPVTSGTATGVGPRLTTSATAEPGATCRPAAGS